MVKIANLVKSSVRWFCCSRAKVSTTNLRDYLRNYQEFTDSNPCRVKLVSADGNPYMPLGVGLLTVPALNARGHVLIRCYHTPGIIISNHRSSPCLSLLFCTYVILLRYWESEFLICDDTIFFFWCANHAGDTQNSFTSVLWEVQSIECMGLDDER